MLFTSAVFFRLLLGAFVAFYVWPNVKWQSIVLIVASFIFYAWNAPWLLILLVASLLINSVVSFQVARSGDHRIQKTWAISGIVANLVILGSFKYAGLLGRTMMALTHNSTAFELLLTIPLPIGISFYTFEGISLVMDCYKPPTEQKIVTGSFWQHLVNTSIFTAFFPHLISGPILRARHFFPQINVKQFKDIRWDPALRCLITGFFLKTVVADNLADQTSRLAYPNFLACSGPTLVLLIVAYGVQMFADFAGYSLIAIGLGRLFGFEIPDNFRFPFLSASIAEFWSRWHISLSTWLRDYLYFPLGGNRKGKARMLFAILLTMSLGGLWHGAQWGYMLWGFYEGVGLVIERLLGQSHPKNMLLIRRIGCFVFFNIGLLIFRMNSPEMIGKFVSLIAQRPTGIDTMVLAPVLFFSFPVLVYHLAGRWMEKNPVAKHRYTIPAYAAMLFFLATSRGNAGSFFYFQF